MQKKFIIHCVINGFSNGEWSKILSQNSIPYSVIKLGRITRKISLKYLKWNIDALIHLPLALIRFSRIINQFKPKIVFFDSHIPLFFLIGIIKKYKIPCIIRHAENTKRDFFLNSVLKRKKDLLIIHIAISKHIAEHLKSIGIPSNQINVIYNGFEYPDKNILIPDNQFVKKYNIGYIGQINEDKGIIYLLEALKILNESTSNKYTCLIAGDGDKEYISKINKYINEHSLSSEITFLGYVKNTHLFYNSIDICVMPTLTAEPFGRVAAEAGLHRKPVIASAVGALPEIIISGTTGYLVPPGNAGEIVEKISVLLQSPTLMESIGQNAYNHIKANFGLNTMLSNYEIILDSNHLKNY